MKKYLNLRLITLLGAAIFSVGIAGCGTKLQEKTLILQENQSDKNQDVKFELSKLTKIEGKGTIKGWLNENELLTSTGIHPEDKDEIGRYKWLELRNLNYNNLESKKILEGEFSDVVLSPDGIKTVYRKHDNNKGIIGFIDLKSGKDTRVGKYDVLGPINWSANSRYFSCVAEEGIIVYDVEINELKQYSITDLKTPSGAGDVLVSDDGKHAFVALEAELYMIELSSGNMVPKSKLEMEKYRITNGIPAYFMFLNNSEALFLGGKGELGAICHYDINTKEIKEIIEDVSGFKLAVNSKNIVYISNSTLYAGYLSNNKITSSSVIFKGSVGSQLWWNKDNKKFVFQGKEQGSSALKQYVAELK